MKINEGRANYFYKKWTETHDDVNVGNMGEYLERIDSSIYGTPRYYNLQAIYCFINNQDTQKSLDWLNKHKKSNRDATWDCNTAFLRAYDGDLKSASRDSRRCAELIPPAEIISMIEEFLLLFATREPEKFQLYFCLGYFNWKIKGDNIAAIKDFKKFIENENIDLFSKEKELVEGWIEDLEK